MSDLAVLGAEPDDAPRPITRTHVAAAVLGNGLEFYDFTTYAFFAVQIGRAFFPGHSAFLSLMLSLGTFGAGFILRPIGAVVIGRWADRHGRRPAMLVSFALMGLAILGLALTPGYAAIGPAASVMVVAWRVVQGFALGGEVGPTTAFLVEAAPPDKRGRFGAWQSASQNLASIVGGMVGIVIAGLAGAAFLEAWGWRIAFLLGALVLPFGLVIRRALPETLHHPETDPAHGLERSAGLRGQAGVLALGLGLIASSTVSTYVMNFMTTYAITTLGLPPDVSLRATLANGCFGVLGVLLGGWLTDRFGRRPLLILPRLAFLALTLPAFSFMVAHRDATTLVAATATLALVGAFTGAATLVSITESLHKEVRGQGLGIVYATAVAVFGGTTQPIIAWLTHATGNPLAPAWYMMAFTTIGVLAALGMKESGHAHRRTAAVTVAGHA